MDVTLYPGIPFSPQVSLTNNTGEADTIIEVSDVSAFPDAPNLATIGTDEEGETILYTAKTETALSGCRRGVEGVPRAWEAGERIGRNFTAKDHADLIAAVLEMQDTSGAAQDTAQAAQETAQAAAASAQAAQETAHSAAQDAIAAKTTAQGAETSANAAQETARTAAQDAGEAKSTAQAASDAAASASEAVGAVQEALQQKQDKLTGEAGQVPVFNASGVLEAQDFSGSAVTAFTEADWQSDGADGYKIVLTAEVHKRKTADFGFQTFHLLDGRYAANTWAALGTEVRFDTEAQTVTLQSSRAYPGKILFVG